MKRILCALIAAVFLSGCAAYYERSADRETLPIVDSLNKSVEAEMPEETPDEVIEVRPDGPQAVFTTSRPSGDEPRILNLNDCLALAFSTSRDYLFQRESLYLSALGYTFTRHKYSWRPSASISGDYTVSGNSTSRTTQTADGSAALSLTKRLLSGGEFDVSASMFQDGRLAGPVSDSNSSSVSASFSQPLLSGAGIAAREEMVQAERSLLYDARQFELFRQSLAIDIMTRYYQLLRSRRFIETATANVERFEFLHERSQALFDKGKLNLVDVFRAEQQLLSARNELNNNIVAYNLALDRFKIALGLPTDSNVDVADEAIDPVVVKVDIEEAVKTALVNRLDLMTSREQLADTERDVQIARNALLPELDLFLSARDSSEAAGKLFDYNHDDGSASASLSLSLPVDRKSQRNSYKSALISLAREKRSHRLAEDNIILEVRDTARTLQQAEFRLVIEKANWDVAKDRLEASELLLEKGEVSNREVVEAQTELQDAENGFVRAQVDYLIGYAQLLKDIGTLRVDEQGQWH